MSKRRMSPEETKERLVNAGLHLFGIKGFEATRTRELADVAGVNQAAIPYHFGGKEGLYLAVAQVVVERGRKNLYEAADAIRTAAESEGLDRDNMGRLLVSLLHAFLDRIVMAEDIRDRSRFMMREFSSPGVGFDIVYEGLLSHLHKLVCMLVGKLVGQDSESEAVIIRAHVVMGAVMNTLLTRAVLQRRLGWDGYTPERMADIKKIVSEVVALALQFNNPDNSVEAS